MPNPAAAPGCPAWRSRAGGTAGLPDLLDGTMLASIPCVCQAVPWVSVWRQYSGISQAQPTAFLIAGRIGSGLHEKSRAFPTKTSRNVISGLFSLGVTRHES